MLPVSALNFPSLMALSFTKRIQRLINGSSQIEQSMANSHTHLSKQNLLIFQFQNIS